MIKLKRLLLSMISIIILTMKSTHNAPRFAWPYMKTYDIWDTVPSSHVIQNKKSIELVDNGDSNQSYFHENHVQTNQRLSPYNNTNEHHDSNRNRSNGRKAKGKRFFFYFFFLSFFLYSFSFFFMLFHVALVWCN